MANCYTCQNYENAVRNSQQKKNKRAHKAHVVEFTRDDFLSWAERHPRRCRYCGLNDAEYFSLGFRSANGKTLEAIGLDRLVDDDYRLDNIAWCCYPCNRTKGSDYTPEEMDEIGKVLGTIRRRRLAARNGQATLFPVESRPIEPIVLAEMPGEHIAGKTTLLRRIIDLLERLDRNTRR